MFKLTKFAFSELKLKVIIMALMILLVYYLNLISYIIA